MSTTTAARESLGPLDDRPTGCERGADDVGGALSGVVVSIDLTSMSSSFSPEWLRCMQLDVLPGIAAVRVSPPRKTWTLFRSIVAATTPRACRPSGNSRKTFLQKITERVVGRLSVALAARASWVCNGFD